MASSTEPESSGYHSESVHKSELELQDRPSVARDLMDVLKAPTQADICRKQLLSEFFLYCKIHLIIDKTTPFRTTSSLL